MLRTLREQYDDAEFTTNLITDEVSLDLHADVIREVASSMIEKLQTITFPGNPANHCDDGLHNQFVNTILHFSLETSGSPLLTSTRTSPIGWLIILRFTV